MAVEYTNEFTQMTKPLLTFAIKGRSGGIIIVNYSPATVATVNKMPIPPGGGSISLTANTGEVDKTQYRIESADFQNVWFIEKVFTK